MDQGWGRRAVEFATLSEPANCREYVTVHQHLGVHDGHHLLDVACGSGLALELARARGAHCAGIDASGRLVAIARDRNPDSDIKVGDMLALPWSAESFDRVTSFRGVWGTTPDALGEIFRVLRPGGRLGLTVWGHLKASPGVWALAPFKLAARPKVENQASMVSLGRPGIGEALLDPHGFTEVRRVDVPFVWEFADSHHFARTLASTGPAYEAIQNVGETAFLRRPWPWPRPTPGSELDCHSEPNWRRSPSWRGSPSLWERGQHDWRRIPRSAPSGDDADRLFAEDVADVGDVMNASRVWAYNPRMLDGLFELMRMAASVPEMTSRQRAILVAATCSTLGDSYCSLAWGSRLAQASTARIAADVIVGGERKLTPQDAALANWARAVTRHASHTTQADVQALRDVGDNDAQIFASTAFISFRIAFASVNDALGARPDAALRDTTPQPVLRAVDFGRPIEDAPEDQP